MVRIKLGEPELEHTERNIALFAKQQPQQQWKSMTTHALSHLKWLCAWRKRKDERQAEEEGKTEKRENERRKKLHKAPLKANPISFVNHKLHTWISLIGKVTVNCCCWCRARAALSERYSANSHCTASERAKERGRERESKTKEFLKIKWFGTGNGFKAVTSFEIRTTKLISIVQKRPINLHCSRLHWQSRQPNDNGCSDEKRWPSKMARIEQTAHTRWCLHILYATGYKRTITYHFGCIE